MKALAYASSTLLPILAEYMALRLKDWVIEQRKKEGKATTWSTTRPETVLSSCSVLKLLCLLIISSVLRIGQFLIFANVSLFAVTVKGLRGQRVQGTQLAFFFRGTNGVILLVDFVIGVQLVDSNSFRLPHMKSIYVTSLDRSNCFLISPFLTIFFHLGVSSDAAWRTQKIIRKIYQSSWFFAWNFAADIKSFFFCKQWS
jgi:hypothetical protein